MLYRNLNSAHRTHDPEALAAVSRFQDIRAAPESFPGYSIKQDITLPYSPEVVWQLILETQFLGDWLFSGGGGQTYVLPSSFYVGQRVGKKPVFIVDAQINQEDKRYQITFHWGTGSGLSPFYYTVAVRRNERFDSTIELGCEYRGDKPTGVAWLLFSIENIFGAKQRYLSYMDEQKLLQQLYQFGEVCWSRVNSGPIDEDSCGMWTRWLGVDGVVQYFTGKNGNIGLEIGEVIQAEERVGFVKPADGTGTIEQWREKYPISPIRGFVAIVLKKHGDRISYNDRILMTVNEPSDATSLAELSFRRVRESVGRYIIGFSLKEIKVEVGEKVRQGDVLALVQNDLPGLSPLVELLSPYTGTIVRFGSDRRGTKTSSNDHEVFLIIDCERVVIQ